MTTNRNAIWWETAAVSRPMYTHVRKEHMHPNIIIGGGIMAYALAYNCYMSDIPATVLTNSMVGIGNSSRQYGGLGYLPDMDIEKQVLSFHCLDKIVMDTESYCILSEAGTIYPDNPFGECILPHIYKQNDITYSPQTFFINPLVLLGDLAKFAKFAEIPVYEGRDIRFTNSMELYVDGAKYNYNKLIFLPDSYNEYSNSNNKKFKYNVPFRKAVCFTADINSNELHENYNVFYNDGLHITYHNSKLFGEILLPPNKTVKAEILTSKEITYTNKLLEHHGYFLTNFSYLWPRLFVAEEKKSAQILYSNKKSILAENYGYQELNNLYLLDEILDEIV